tara:strand:- start:102 stop:1862 length:1761 start_codon:yes stop_codon:yes gene_type:complete
MSKFPILTILTFLLFAVGVNAAPSFNILENFVNVTSSAGQTLTTGLTFTVNNTGTTNLNINFTGYALTYDSNQIYITLLDNITNMDNGTTQGRTFSVEIPAQQIPGKYTRILTANSNSTDTGPDTVQINVNVTPTYSVSTIPSSGMDLGSAGLNETKTNLLFNITNTGNADITNVYFEFSESGFNLQSNKTNFILEYNAMETIEFNITIPASSSTGNVTLGSVNLVSTELSKTLFSVNAGVGGGLIIEDLDVFLTTRVRRSSDGTLESGNENDLDITDGRKLNFGNENVGPESQLRFNLNIKNTFTDKEDIDIDDITVKVTIESIDDGEDIEEESNEFNLDSDDHNDLDVTVMVPLSVDEDVYDIIIDVEGKDDNGNKHSVQMNLKIDIDKVSRNVIVSKASLFPGKIKCSGSSVLTATIKNIGSRIEEETGIEITNSDLGINFEKQDIELGEDPFDSDNEFTKKLIIDVDGNTKAGTYPITVKSYLQEEIPWETKTVDFVVEACSQAQEEPEEEEEEINETETVEVSEEPEEETTEGEKISILEPTTTTEVSLTKKPLFWVGIVLVNIALIVVIFFFVAKLVGKK